MKHSSIVPLIGGELFGSMLALKGYDLVEFPLKENNFIDEFPEELLSFSPFKANESHLISYLRKKGWAKDYVILDEKTSHRPKTVDVVSTVCPCAGLSSLSRTSSSEAAINDWMYKTAEFVLENIQPQVFWGENAPALATKKGKAVVDKLKVIAKKNDYTLGLVKTKNSLHGIPQKRSRSFYIFVKEKDAFPMFSFKTREETLSEKVLSLPRDLNDPMQKTILNKNLYENEFFQICLEITQSQNSAELSKHFVVTQNLFRFLVENISSEQLEEIRYETAKKKLLYAKEKVASGKNFWAHGIALLKGVIPALVANIPTEGINYHHDDFITARESLRLMGMPDDFYLIHNLKTSINHVCQNVPVFTARDICSQIRNYLDGKIPLCNTTEIPIYEIRKEKSNLAAFLVD